MNFALCGYVTSLDFVVNKNSSTNVREKLWIAMRGGNLSVWNQKDVIKQLCHAGHPKDVMKQCVMLDIQKNVVDQFCHVYIKRT